MEISSTDRKKWLSQNRAIYERKTMTQIIVIDFLL